MRLLFEIVEKLTDVALANVPVRRDDVIECERLSCHGSVVSNPPHRIVQRRPVEITEIEKKRVRDRPKKYIVTLLTCKHEEFKLPHPIRPMSGSAFRTGTKKARNAGTTPLTGLPSLQMVAALTPVHATCTEMQGQNTGFRQNLYR